MLTKTQKNPEVVSVKLHFMLLSKLMVKIVTQL